MKTFTRNRRRKFIETYAYAPDVTKKLQEELGDRATALRALEGLDAWFIACLHADDRMIGMPSKIVDIAWHEFILRTREYTNFCQSAFGAYLHHTPDSTMKVAATSLLPATLEIVERHAIPMVLFTADEDSGYRDGYVYSTADLHRMRDTYSHPPRRSKRRRYAYSGGSSSGYAGGGGCGGFFGGDSGGGGGDGGGGGCGGGGCGGGG
jgi:hypothetical protein